MWHLGTWVVGTVVMGQQMDLMILQVFFNLNDFMIPGPSSQICAPAPNKKKIQPSNKTRAENLKHIWIFEMEKLPCSASQNIPSWKGSTRINESDLPACCKLPG